MPPPDAGGRASAQSAALSRRRAERPVAWTCAQWLPGFAPAEAVGAGDWHINEPKPGPRLLFNCEWRAKRGAGDASSSMVLQGACGDAGEQLRQHYWPQPARGEALQSVGVGISSSVTESRRLGGRPLVRLAFETFDRPSCVVRVEATADLHVALAAARAIDAALVSFGPAPER